MFFKRNIIRAAIVASIFSHTVYAAKTNHLVDSNSYNTIKIINNCNNKENWNVNDDQSENNDNINSPDSSCHSNHNRFRNHNKYALNPANYLEYAEGTKYQSGDIVRAVGSNNLYQCQDGATSPWCSGPAWAYAPATGSAWTSAWNLLSSTSAPDTTEKPTPEPTPEPDIDVGNGSENKPTTANFDYRNQQNSLTKAKIQYNKYGKISAEKAVETSGKIVGGYVSEWSVYERGFDLERLAGKSYNRLVYAFAGICGDKASGKASDTVRAECKKQGLKEHEMVILDPWAGFIKPVNSRQEKMGWHDSYQTNNPAMIPKNRVRGLMGQLQQLKIQNEDLKVAISVGGWTLSEPFHRMSASQQSRATFVNSIISFIHKWDLDGVDIDWEFPGHGGESGQWTKDDGQNFALLIVDMKNALNRLSTITGKNYEVSSAVGATDNYINKIGKHYRLINTAIDNIYLMNYDYFGAWENKLGHQSNLKKSSSIGSNFSIERAIEQLQLNGLSKDKIVLGVANYSRGAQAPLYNTSPVSSSQTTYTRVFGSWEDTVIEGYDLFPNMAGDNMKGVNGWELRTDAEANADYFYNYSNQIFHSIDTPRTAYLKAKYAKDHGLKGAFVWTVEQDYNGQVVNAMNDGFDHKMTNLYTSPQDRAALYNTCGDNISVTECYSLNGGEITITAAIEDPDKLLSTKHLHLKNDQFLAIKWRIWEGNHVIFYSNSGLTSGLSNLLLNQKITKNTKIEALALIISSKTRNKIQKLTNSEQETNKLLNKLFDELENNQKFRSIIQSYDKNRGVQTDAIIFIAELLGIPTSWGDLFIGIAIDTIFNFTNSFNYTHFGWVDMNAVINTKQPDVMIKLHRHHNISVEGVDK